MLAAQLDLEIDHNSAFSKVIVWTNSDGSAKTLFGYTASLDIEKGAKIVASITDVTMLQVNFPLNGQITINIPWSELTALEHGNYHYHFYVIEPVTSITTKVMTGRLRVR